MKKIFLAILVALVILGGLPCLAQTYQILDRPKIRLIGNEDLVWTRNQIVGWLGNTYEIVEPSYDPAYGRQPRYTRYVCQFLGGSVEDEKRFGITIDTEHVRYGQTTNRRVATVLLRIVDQERDAVIFQTLNPTGTSHQINWDTSIQFKINRYPISISAFGSGGNDKEAVLDFFRRLGSPPPPPKIVEVLVSP